MSNHGYIRIMTASPEVFPGDIRACLDSMKMAVDDAVSQGASILALPELCLTSSSCGDLFRNTRFLCATEESAVALAEHTLGKDIAVCFSFPMALAGRVYSVSALACGGKILGIVPLDAGNGSWKGFSDYRGDVIKVRVGGCETVFGRELVFCSDSNRYLTVGISDSSDDSQSASLVILPDASREMIGGKELRKDAIRLNSLRNLNAEIYVSSGMGESTSDGVFSGHALISECGDILSESEIFGDGKCICDIDLELIEYRRNTAGEGKTEDGACRIMFTLAETEHDSLIRKYSPLPFLSADEKELHERCRTAFEIQSRGLAERLKKTGAVKAVLGVSGGLDSTLALLVSVHAMELLGRDSSNVIAVSMPCFGTSSRTKSNAEKMCDRLGVDFRLIDISESVRIHLKDIGHDEETADTAYENAQARERTQVLMDISNMENGLVVGTGDMSESALGWCTFNGDHMSMYNVNCSMSKTFIRAVVTDHLKQTSDRILSSVLADVVDTPISPELKPGLQGEIAQKTEEILGPYDAHDFFLYHFVRNGACREKLQYIAEEAFNGRYDAEQLRTWLEIFMKRFFSSQFKRSCAPDGPVIGTVNLSRDGFSFPSDTGGKTVLLV